MARLWGSSSASTQTAQAAAAAATDSTLNSTTTRSRSSSISQQQQQRSSNNKHSHNDEPSLVRTPDASSSRPTTLRPRSASRDATASTVLFAQDNNTNNASSSSSSSTDWQHQHAMHLHNTTTTNNNNNIPHTPRRSRMNSRDIPRSYSGLYGNGDSGDLLPFELNRSSNGSNKNHYLVWQVLAIYVTLLAVQECLSLVATEWSRSWTLTNIVHLLVTLTYVHWLKGSLYDEQGEMNALTVWEQLEATQGTKAVRQVLLVVPTALCYCACHFANYNLQLSVLNVCVWLVAVLAKLPFMNGVRIFGINRTAGIDDDDIIIRNDPDCEPANKKKQ